MAEPGDYFNQLAQQMYVSPQEAQGMALRRQAQAQQVSQAMAQRQQQAQQFQQQQQAAQKQQQFQDSMDVTKTLQSYNTGSGLRAGAQQFLQQGKITPQQYQQYLQAADQMDLEAKTKLIGGLAEHGLSTTAPPATMGQPDVNPGYGMPGSMMPPMLPTGQQAPPAANIPGVGNVWQMPPPPPTPEQQAQIAAMNALAGLRTGEANNVNRGLTPTGREQPGMAKNTQTIEQGQAALAKLQALDPEKIGEHGTGYFARHLNPANQTDVAALATASNEAAKFLGLSLAQQKAQLPTVNDPTETKTAKLAALMEQVQDKLATIPQTPATSSSANGLMPPAPPAGGGLARTKPLTRNPQTGELE